MTSPQASELSSKKELHVIFLSLPAREQAIIDATATSLQGVYSALIGQILQTYYSILEYNSYIQRNSVQATKS